MAATTARKHATEHRLRSTLRLCRDKVQAAPERPRFRNASPSKALTRARYAVRINNARMAELREELERREAKAVGLQAELKRATAELLAVDPDGFLRLHDVSGGVR